MAAIVSASKDGALLAAILQCFGVQPVRGSSSRLGREAATALVGVLRGGNDVGITPDGPRGPKYKVADGVISLAQLTGAPIVPLSYDLSHKFQLNSWDGFMIPLPFGRATLRVGPLVNVPAAAVAEEREHKRLELETILKSLSEL